jgi:hypothetical protein
MNNIKSSSKRHGIFNRLVGLLIIISLLFLTGCSVKASTGSAESELSGTAPSKIAETDTAAAGSTGSSSGENSSGARITPKIQQQHQKLGRTKIPQPMKPQPEPILMANPVIPKIPATASLQIILTGPPGKKTRQVLRARTLK